jgi:hypothetical protein
MVPLAVIAGESSLAPIWGIGSTGSEPGAHMETSLASVETVLPAAWDSPAVSTTPKSGARLLRSFIALALLSRE